MRKLWKKLFVDGVKIYSNYLENPKWHVQWYTDWFTMKISNFEIAISVRPFFSPHWHPAGRQIATRRILIEW